jgi:hypothetical protein
VTDGYHGAIICWEDLRSGDDLYAQRVDRDGDPYWETDGVPICTAAGGPIKWRIVTDEHQGAIVGWSDSRGVDDDIYAHKVYFDGTLGPPPEIFEVADVPADQGRQVSVMWDRSPLDTPQYQMITEYSIWRKFPTGSKITSRGEEWKGCLPEDRSGTVYRQVEREDENGVTKTDYWEMVGTVDAVYLEGYAYSAPTLYDSSASDPAYFSFLVIAHTDEPYIEWSSDPDSGYSVDDINPAKTQVGIMASGNSKGSVNTIWLSWDQVTVGVDSSLEHGSIDYRIYCEETPGFTPEPGNLLMSTSGLSYPHTDTRIGDSAVNLYYLVTAVDCSGNESAASNVVGVFDKSLSDVK